MRSIPGVFIRVVLAVARLFQRCSIHGTPTSLLPGSNFVRCFLNDPVQKASINTGPINVSINWDPLPEGFQTPVLMSRGGPNDTYNALGIEVINFENTMQQSRTYLQDAGRLVMDCPHTLGHTFPPGLTVADIVAFFKAHPHGSEALYAENGLPSNLSGVCDPL